jgi:hypothetical protein
MVANNVIVFYSLSQQIRGSKIRKKFELGGNDIKIIKAGYCDICPNAV